MWEIRAEHDEHRYSAFLDGERVGHAAWVRLGDLVVVPHVRVAADYRFVGVDTDLAGRICDDARAQGFTVLAACPFMLGYAYLQPRYDDMLRAPHPGEIAALAPLIEAVEDEEERRLAAG